MSSQQPRWKTDVSVEEKGREFVRCNQRLQAICRTWTNGFEFSNERLEEFCKCASVVFDVVHEIANKSGVNEYVKTESRAKE